MQLHEIRAKVTRLMLETQKAMTAREINAVLLEVPVDDPRNNSFRLENQALAGMVRDGDLSLTNGYYSLVRAE